MWPDWLAPRGETIMNCARAEADSVVSSEHILAGIVLEKFGLGAKFLEERGITIESIREGVADIKRREEKQLALNAIDQIRTGVAWADGKSIPAQYLDIMRGR